MLLRLAISGHDSHAVIRAIGEVDTSTAATVTEAIRAAVTDGYPTIVVDLSAVTFIDSTGISALVAGSQSADLAGCYLALVAADDQAIRVMHLLGLDRDLHLHHTLAEALAHG
jgi:anti-anti-sigma factor